MRSVDVLSLLPEKSALYRLLAVHSLLVRATVFLLSILLLDNLHNSKQEALLAVLCVAIYVGIYGLSRSKGLASSNWLLLLDVAIISLFFYLSNGSAILLLLYVLEVMEAGICRGLRGGLAVSAGSSAACILALWASSNWVMEYWKIYGVLLLVGFFSGQAGNCLARGVENELQQQAERDRQLEVSKELAEIKGGLLASFDVDVIVDQLLEKGMALFAAEGAFIALPGQKGDLCVKKAKGIVATCASDLPLLFCQRHCFNPAVSGGMLSDLMWEDEGPLSVLWADIALHGGQQGAIAFLRGQDFEEQDISYAINLAATAASSINSAQFHDQLKRRNAQLVLLNQIGRSISATLDMDALFEIMYREIAQVMPTDAFFVGLYDAHSQRININFLYENGHRYPPLEMALSEGLVSHVITTAEPLIWQEDIAKQRDIALAGEKQAVVESGLMMPMQHGQRVIGVVSAQSYRAHAYTDEHVELLTTVASQAAVAFTNATLYEHARQLSLTDELTGLANARLFNRELESLLRRAAQEEDQVALLMIDSDSLKQINDKYGHEVGDRHLQSVARIIRAQLGPRDFAARYAGDEFVVVLPGADRPKAEQTAHRIHQQVASHREEVEGDSVCATVSIGAACYPLDAVTPEGLFRAADQAMYKTKASRRR